METRGSNNNGVLRAQVHDREALELLLRSVQPSLRRFLRSMVGNTDADDVLQNVLIQICRKLTWLRAPALFHPWAFRIARRAEVRYSKKYKRWNDRSVDDFALETLSAPAVLPINDLRNAVLVVLNRQLIGRATEYSQEFNMDIGVSRTATLVDTPNC